MNALIADIIKTAIEDLAFVDRIAGIVKPVTISEDIDGQKRVKTFPVACNVTEADCVSGQYTDLVPNSQKNSVIYFEDLGVQFIGNVKSEMRFRSQLRLVCWLNLKRMGITDCNWSSTATLHIIKSILQADVPFNSTPFTGMKYTGISQPVKSASIFSKYSYSEQVNQYLLYPYDYFAVDFVVEYGVKAACIEDLPELGPELCETGGGTVTPDTITINDALWSNIICGNSYEIAVVNESLTPVGTKIGNYWVVPSGGGGSDCSGTVNTYLDGVLVDSQASADLTNETVNIQWV